MKIKRIISAFLAGAMLITAVCFTGCENAENSSEVNSSATEEKAPMRDIPSTELVKEMKIGWSLGNTFDGGSEGNRGASVKAQETAWGNPVTTKEMIDEVKKAGFNVFRFPVTWSYFTGEAPDYKISEEWLARIKEVVDYAIDNDMFVILNMHHETWNTPSPENYEAASAQLKAMWTQIGNYFENYDEHLIFEGMNEPRLKDTAEEWMGGSPETREIVNKLGADFVETIRSLGGNNPLRHLMIPGYAASSLDIALKDIRVPEDDKVIVSVHAYIPFNFALSDNGNQFWFAHRESFTGDIDRLAALLKELFIDKGQAVVMGEFGARNRYNEKYRANWVKYYITTMNSIGVPCVWWDNNYFSGSGETFGLFNRRTFKWEFPDLMDAMMNAVDGKYTIEEIKAEGEQLYKDRKEEMSNNDEGD